jgi:hypothetical protein
MKRIYSFGAALGILLAGSQAFALTVTTEGGSGYGPYQTGVGGEFTLHISDASLISGYYSGAVNQVASTPNFQTFCVEGLETILPNTSYTALYNNQSVYSYVPLSKGAAYLYWQFATGGTFGGYSGAVYNYGGGYGSGSGARAGDATYSSAALMQNAIWAFMGQEGKNATTEASNPFFNAAIAAEGGSFAAADAAAVTGYHSVYVLNLWQGGLPQDGGRAAQDQLIYTPGAIPNVIPDGGMTAMLLGFGMTGLAFISRRVRR